MAEAKTEVKKALQQFAYIRFTFLDMNGVSRGCILPTASAMRFLESGTGCFSGLQAYGPNNEVIYPKEVLECRLGDVSMIPDLETLHAVPWLPRPEHKVGQLLCGTFWDKSTPQEACSRGILKRILGKLDEANLKILTGIELEFNLIDKTTKEPVFAQPDYMCVLTQSNFHALLVDIDQNVKEAGISLERIHCEYAPGQFEVTTSPRHGVEGIDACVIVKQAIIEMASQKGYQATFMSKHSLSSDGNSLNLNFSLWQKEKEENVFWDASSPDKLSKIAKHWIAGLVHHAGALTAICCPTTNCYLHIHNPWFADRANWGIQDRNAMIRVKNDGPKGTYFESRLPTGLANPYLALAATMLAGLDGVQRELLCPEPHDSAAPHLPFSLQEALEALQEDEVMVKGLGKIFVEWFVMSKTESELKPVKGITDRDELLAIQIQKYARLL